AHFHLAGGLVGHATALVDRVGLGVAFRNATGLRDRDHLRAHFLLAHRHPDDFRVALRVLLHHGAALLDPHRAGNPDLDGLCLDRLAARRGARIAAIALVPEVLLEVVGEARPTRDFLALVVAVILALLRDVRDRLAHGDALHHRPLLDTGDGHAIIARH